MTPVAEQLAAWAAGLEPSDDDLALARRSLADTVAVAVAARAHPIGDLLGGLSEAEAWAVLAHVLDFDDLHMESTSHVSAVCVPACTTGAVTPLRASEVCTTSTACSLISSPGRIPNPDPVLRVPRS